MTKSNDDDTCRICARLKDVQDELHGAEDEPIDHIKAANALGELMAVLHITIPNTQAAHDDVMKAFMSSLGANFVERVADDVGPTDTEDLQDAINLINGKSIVRPPGTKLH